MAIQIRETRENVGGLEVLLRRADLATVTPTLYLHGVPTHGGDWVPFLQRIGGVAPDLPGFGRSDKPASFEYSIPGYARWLRQLVDHLGFDRFRLAMHDWGGVGLALAQEAPELVERLVAIDVVPFLPGYRWHPVARVWRTPLAGELFMGFSSRWASKQIMRRLRALPEDQIGRVIDETWPYFDHGTQRAILHLYRSAPSETLAKAGERLGHVTAPALVVWGDQDPFVPPDLAGMYAEALGGPTTVDIVRGASHWPWLHDPAVIDRVTTFLAG